MNLDTLKPTYFERSISSRPGYKLCKEVNRGAYKVMCVLEEGHGGMHVNDGRLTGITEFGEGYISYIELEKELNNG